MKGRHDGKDGGPTTLVRVLWTTWRLRIRARPRHLWWRGGTFLHPCSTWCALLALLGVSSLHYSVCLAYGSLLRFFAVFCKWWDPWTLVEMLISMTKHFRHGTCQIRHQKFSVTNSWQF
jgi:hypothetical protein